ncbi:MAG TPA: hypothetical protein VFA26_08210, partial [Gemmataceae bacterium]|nr:hypothetical protein [Gemmataceae bacterium]
MTAALLALGVDAQALGDWLLRGLAVVGAAALGGFLAGLILQVGAKALAAQTVPKKILQPVRVVGAILVGVLVGYILFHGGPGGGGPGGGWPFGGGGQEGEGRGKEEPPKETVVRKDEAKRDGGEKPGPALTVEVLGDERARGDRIYRVEGGSG